MRAHDAVEDLQYVLWYAFRLLYELVILDETFIIASDETDGLQIWQHCMKFFVFQSFEERSVIEACDRRRGEQYATSCTGQYCSAQGVGCGLDELVCFKAYSISVGV